MMVAAESDVLQSLGGSRLSTHAPARGATGRRAHERHQRCVSTHAPARGATAGFATLQHVGAVSTHAPARGATVGARFGLGGAQVSTHAPARGATPWDTAARHFNVFQPTRPHGARRTPHTRPRSMVPGFNPRARTGRDSRSIGRPAKSLLFQPTRPHGARPGIVSATAAVVDVSTHAPARGATHGLGRLGAADHVSTHAPARGATCSRCRCRA